MTALAMKQKGLKPAAKIVLYWLADHHNSETGACFPSLSRLAEECEMNVATVKRHLLSLEQDRLIQRNQRTRENGSQTSTQYILLIDDGLAQNAPAPSAKCASPLAQNNTPHNLVNNNLVIEPSIMEIPLDTSMFPQLRDRVRAHWAPVFFEPISGSYERFVVGVAAFNHQGFHLEWANQLDRLTCFYGANARGAISAIQIAGEYLQEDLAKRAGQAIGEPDPAVSGISFGDIREAEGNSLEGIAQSWMAALSSLHLSGLAPDSQARELVEFDVFNEIAESVGWPKVRVKTKKRERMVASRIRDCGGFENWREAMQRAADSDFLSGRSTGRTPASFDWLNNASNFTKLMEGNYDNRINNNANTNTALDAISFAARNSTAPREDCF